MEGGIYLLLGTNLGNRLEQLTEALTRISSFAQVKVTSPVYMTGAWGNKLQPDFLNQAIQVDTQLLPEDLLQKMLMVEIEMGRVRLEKWGPRVIDIDMLFYNDQVVSSKSLTLPHPELANRRFALEPLNDIAPGFIHPVLKKTVQQLLADCTDPIRVTRLPHQP